MPFDRKKYPPHWDAFSAEIRFVRAGGRCECMGECGLHGPSLFNDGKPRRCTELHGEKAKWAKGKVMLTVAHLNYLGGPCRCEPRCAIPEHVSAMCQRCHLRIDIDRHVLNRTKKKDQVRLSKSMFKKLADRGKL